MLDAKSCLFHSIGRTVFHFSGRSLSCQLNANVTFRCFLPSHFRIAPAKTPMPSVWYSKHNPSPCTYCVILICWQLLSVWTAADAMRLVVQKVKSASVTVDGSIVSSIDRGAMALVGLHEHDTKEDLEYCCKKLLGCKLWANDGGALWRQGAKQLGLEILCVSQFTLYGKLTKKHQPDYKHAMKSQAALEMYNEFLDMLRSNYEPTKIKDGVFGAMMDVALVNDGPVTIVIESSPSLSAASSFLQQGEATSQVTGDDSAATNSN